MNPHKDDCNFNDSLGQMIQWSLRSNVARAKPSAEAWRNLERRVQALERCGCERQARRALPLLSMFSGRARRHVARLGYLLKRAVQLLDENTVSSEAIWLPASSSAYAANALRNRTISLWVVARPIFGHLMPIF